MFGLQVAKFMMRDKNLMMAATNIRQELGQSMAVFMLLTMAAFYLTKLRICPFVTTFLGQTVL